MKHIILGRLLFRVLAKLIDFTIVIINTIIVIRDAEYNAANGCQS